VYINGETKIGLERHEVYSNKIFIHSGLIFHICSTFSLILVKMKFVVTNYGLLEFTAVKFHGLHSTCHLAMNIRLCE